MNDVKEPDKAALIDSMAAEEKEYYEAMQNLSPVIKRRWLLETLIFSQDNSQSANSIVWWDGYLARTKLLLDECGTLDRIALGFYPEPLPQPPAPNPWRWLNLLNWRLTCKNISTNT